MLELFFKKYRLISGLSFRNRQFKMFDLNFAGKTVYIYNGKKFIPIILQESMLNQNFGNFLFTKRLILKKKKKKKYGARRKSNKF